MNEGPLDFQKLEEIYATLNDGRMPACLGANCPSSCCTQHLATRGDQSVLYQTLLWDKTEADFQIQKGLLDTGAVIYQVSGNGYKVPGKKLPDKELYMVGNCQNKDGSCKLKNRKPILCNTYPLIMDAEQPIVSTCPRAVEIFEDDEVVNRILRVRKLLGFTEPREWEFNAQDQVSSLKEARDLNVRYGQSDYK